MEKELKPELVITNYKFSIKDVDVFININMRVYNFLIKFPEAAVTSLHSKLSMFLAISNENIMRNNMSEDINKIKNFQIDEEILNKYFTIRISFGYEIKFSEFNNEEYKKFILDNLNRAIMEYNL